MTEERTSFHFFKATAISAASPNPPTSPGKLFIPSAEKTWRGGGYVVSGFPSKK